MIRELIAKREKLEALLFFGLNSLSLPLWWLTLILWPNTRAFYFGTQYVKNWRWDFAFGDNLAAVVGFVLCLAILKEDQNRRWLAWVYVGMLAYPWALSVGIALADPSAYLGVVIMSMTLTASVAFALRMQGFNILWGPFRFQKACSDAPLPLKVRSFRQICVMWGTFLLLLPLVIATGETLVGWQGQWIHLPFQGYFGAILFVVAGWVGLRSNAAMNRDGDGTPLPSDCASRLVLSGPYALLRNPMALSGITQGVAVAIMIGSPLVLVYALTGGVWWEVLVRPLEEEYLESEFGEEYLLYVRETRCWIPKL